MPLNYLTPKVEPTGNQLARLADVPLEQRLAALHHIMVKDTLTAEEAQTMLDMCLDPGDLSTRIAA